MEQWLSQQTHSDEALGQAHRPHPSSSVSVGCALQAPRLWLQPQPGQGAQPQAPSTTSSQGSQACRASWRHVPLLWWVPHHCQALQQPSGTNTPPGAKPQILVQILGNVTGQQADLAGRTGRGVLLFLVRPHTPPGPGGGPSVSSQGNTFTSLPTGLCHAPAVRSCTHIPPSLEKMAENKY